MGDIGDYWREHKEHKQRKKRGAKKHGGVHRKPASRAAHESFDAPSSGKKRVVIFTDGGCWPNPGGCGGWGAYLILDGTEHRKELFGGEPSSTNNRMEMTAAIMALQALKEPCDVKILTDSKYLRDGITKWMENWKRRGWITAEGSPVKNQELWREIDRLCSVHNVTWKWVPGHKGVRGNEKADFLAMKGRKTIEGTWEERERA